MEHVTKANKSQGATITTHNGTLETKMGQVTNGPSANALKYQNGVLENGVAVNGDVVDDGQLLKAALELVLKERLVTGLDPGSKVVEFKQPDELQVGVVV